MGIRNIRPKGEEPYYCLYKGNKFLLSIGKDRRPYDNAVKETKELIKALKKKPIIALEFAMSVQKMLAWARNLDLKIKLPDIPVGDVYYADPPWKYDFSETTTREIENQYPTMELEAIKQLEIPAPENAVLFLWATAPKLPEALEVMAEWGFQYKTQAVWDKEKIGMGYWFRGQHELLLIGTRGAFPAPSADARLSSVIRKKRTEHSVKPPEVHDMIERMCPNLRYVELFARSKYNEKWQVWGYESDR